MLGKSSFFYYFGAVTIPCAMKASFILFAFFAAYFNGSTPLKDHSFALEKEYNWAATADSVYQATFQAFLSKDDQYIAQNNAGNQTFHYWWNAHVLDVVVDAHLRGTDQKDMMLTILRGIKNHNEGLYPNNYYDDMEWLALSTLRAYHATGDKEFLEATSILWKDIKGGWNDHEGGGIAWRKTQLDYKNTPANAPAVILAARLYKEQQNPEDLEWAKKIYEWQKSHLVDSETGLVWDGVNRNGDGQIDKDWKFTYNHGVYIGAAAALYELTGEQAYLDDAIKTADFVISDTNLSPGGILKSEGSGDGGLFKGILVRYLAEIIQSGILPDDREAAYADFLKQNAITLHKNIKRPQMLIGPSWNKPSEKVIDSSVQLSGLMLLEAMALLDGEG